MPEPIHVNPEATIPQQVPLCNVFILLKYNAVSGWDRCSVFDVLPWPPIERVDERVFHLTDAPNPAIVEAEELIRAARNDWMNGFFAVPANEHRKNGMDRADAWLAKYGKAEP